MFMNRCYYSRLHSQFGFIQLQLLKGFIIFVVEQDFEIS